MPSLAPENARFRDATVSTAVNCKHVQKGIAKVVAGGHDRWNGSDVGGGMNVACVRDTPDRYFLITYNE